MRRSWWPLLAALLLALASSPARAEGEHLLSFNVAGGFFWEQADAPLLLRPHSGGGLLPSDGSTHSLWPSAVGDQLSYEYRYVPRQAIGLRAELWSTGALFSEQTTPQTRHLLNVLASWRYFVSLNRNGGSYILLGAGVGWSGTSFSDIGAGTVFAGKVQVGHLFALTDHVALSLSVEVNGGPWGSEPPTYFIPVVNVGVNAGTF